MPRRCRRCSWLRRAFSRRAPCSTDGVALVGWPGPALKDLVADFAGWVFILARRSFDLGDRIQIGPHAGGVVDRGIFHCVIMEIGNWVETDQSTTA